MDNKTALDKYRMELSNALVEELYIVLGEETFDKGPQFASELYYTMLSSMIGTFILKAHDDKLFDVHKAVHCLSISNAFKDAAELAGIALPNEAEYHCTIKDVSVSANKLPV